MTFERALDIFWCWLQSPHLKQALLLMDIVSLDDDVDVPQAAADGRRCTGGGGDRQVINREHAISLEQARRLCNPPMLESADERTVLRLVLILRDERDADALIGGLLQNQKPGRSGMTEWLRLGSSLVGHAQKLGLLSISLKRQV